MTHQAAPNGNTTPPVASLDPLDLMLERMSEDYEPPGWAAAGRHQERSHPMTAPRLVRILDEEPPTAEQPATRTCQLCGAVAGDAWPYCQTCGNDAATAPTDRPTLRSEQPDPFPHDEPTAIMGETERRVASSWADLIRDAIEVAGPDRTVHVHVEFTIEPK